LFVNILLKQRLVVGKYTLALISTRIGSAYT